MNDTKNINDFLEQFMQTKISLMNLIENYQNDINNHVPFDNRKEYNRVLFILRNKYEMLDMIQSEIRYLAANKVNEAMKINYD
jgi:hypothetical protein